MLVSIIVPIYGVEKFLIKCITSIMNQTYRDLEIILVDDGSKDSCPQICDEFALRDKRIRVIHKENGGLVSARQIGLKESKADFVMYVDGDDWVHQDYVRKMMDIILQKEVDLVCCASKIVYNDCEKYNPIAPRNGMFNRRDIEKEIFPMLISSSTATYFSHNAWGKLYRRHLLLPLQLDVNPKINMGEDAAFVEAYVYKSRAIYIISGAFYCYNKTNDVSMTNVAKPLPWDSPLMLLEGISKNIDMNKYDFKNQLNRCITHFLFNVCISRFNQPLKYGEIKREIKLNLGMPLYFESIKKAKFKGLKGRLCLFIMKYRMCIFMYFFYRIKWRKRND